MFQSTWIFTALPPNDLRAGLGRNCNDKAISGAAFPWLDRQEWVFKLANWQPQAFYFEVKCAFGRLDGRKWVDWDHFAGVESIVRGRITGKIGCGLADVGTRKGIEE